MTTFVLLFARMAELVDALVSNTSGISLVGSIPTPGTVTIGGYIQL